MYTLTSASQGGNPEGFCFWIQNSGCGMHGVMGNEWEDCKTFGHHVIPWEVEIFCEELHRAWGVLFLFMSQYLCKLLDLGMYRKHITLLRYELIR